MNIYKVGGCVRDSILQVKPKDIDYAVEAPSFAAMIEGIKVDAPPINREILSSPSQLTK